MTLLTKHQIQVLLEGTTPGPWELDGVRPHTAHVWPVNGSDDPITGEIDIDNAHLIAAAPDLARTALDALARLEDAEARGMEMAIKTYRTGAGVDNGNYPLWAYDADYEAAVRKKAEVHRKAASDHAGKKET